MISVLLLADIGVDVETTSLLFNNFIQLTLEASPWLLLGLLIAGLMKAWLPKQLLAKHLGSGNQAIVKAALIGAPLPLCSCGVIPVATELRRSGASSPATASFLVATPETGVDSISVSYAMLGPIMAVYRPIAAITSAIVTGLLVKTIPAEKLKSIDDTATKNTEAKNTVSENKQSSCCASKAADPTISSKATIASETAPEQEPVKTSCCASKSSVETKQTSFIEKSRQGIQYALTQLIDDLIKWLLVGLIFATLVKTFIPTEFLTSYGSGIGAMLVMILISVPMYICATASTPIAAGFILAGLSPGTALVFMMSGPATNISTLGVIKNEMGTAVLIRYLIGINSCAIFFGLLLDALLTHYGISIANQMAHSHELLPVWLSALAAITLTVASIKPIRQKIFN
ncbi:SO_0444 family Cu/Zn efflux transporter [Colwellia sp. MEBiC06753]